MNKPEEKYCVFFISWFPAILKSCRKSYIRIVVASLGLIVISMLHFTKLHILTRAETMFIQDNKHYLINTPECRIPYLPLLYELPRTKHPPEKCGKRSVFIKKTSTTEIQFAITKKDFTKHKGFTCCYRFVSRSQKDGEINMQIKYADCVQFTDGTKVPLEQEVIVVECYKKKGKNNVKIYKDSYMLVKKEQAVKNVSSSAQWSVLIMGIDTVSRARAHNEMPRTREYMKRKGWLDFQGYQKMGSNTFPNIMGFMTGENSTSSYHICAKGMHQCNYRLMWSHFKRAGYITAYGEDHLNMGDTFVHLGYRTKPTHHYMRPFFLAGEEKVGSSLCAYKKPTIQTLASYAYDFATTYRHERFFGLFWSNANTHNSDSVASYNDIPIEGLFKSLEEAGVLSNTIVILVSDHGRRFGRHRNTIEGYYDDRLPMLFVWLPPDFRREHPQGYGNALRNQVKMVTPYDLYMTLRDIASAADTSISIPPSAGCSKCASVFSEIPPVRTCRDAGIDNEFCTCHHTAPVDWRRDKRGQEAVDAVLAELVRLAATVEVRKCYVCVRPRLKKVLRVHRFADGSGARYYIVALMTSPGNREHEMYAVQPAVGVTRQRGSTSALTAWDGHGSCVRNKYHSPFCYCRYKCR